MTDAQKLAKISSICNHPGLFGWSGADVARVIRKVLAGEFVIFALTEDEDEPIHYELVHDAVYEEL